MGLTTSGQDLKRNNRLQIDQFEDPSDVIQAPSAIEEDGIYNVIIGDNPWGDEQIALRVLEGMIISAGMVIEDPTGHPVEIDRTDRHVVDRPGHPAHWGIVEEAIRNPMQIWENKVPHGVERHYIAIVNGVWVIVRTYWDGTKWTVSTAVEYANKAEVKQYIKDRNLNRKVFGGKI